MKVLIIVALFAFVAIQVCQSAPVPEDDKANPAVKKDEPTASAADAAPAPAAVQEEKATEPEQKTDMAKAAEPVSPAVAAADEKKEA